MKRIVLLLMIFSIVSMVFSQNKYVDIQINKSKHIRIEPCSPTIVRIRMNQSGNFKESIMERYGIIKKDWKAVDYKTQTSSGFIKITSKILSISVDKNTGLLSWKENTSKAPVHSIRFDVNDSKSKSNNFTKSLVKFFGTEKVNSFIIGDSIKSRIVEKNVVDPIENPSFVNFSLNSTERFYGLGSAVRDRIQHRGNAARIWVKYQKSESPIPYIMSNEGWGVFYNTTKLHYFDVGRFDTSNMTVYGSDDEIDFYLIAGTMPEILNDYTSITGKPFLLPKYAYGLSFGSNLSENQFHVLDNAVKFRQEKIPCDVYWLETQWMANSKDFNYDFTTKKKWDYSNFRPDWPEFQGWEKPEDVKKHLFVYRLNQLGFKIPLWLCVETDLSITEEMRIARKEGKPLAGVVNWFDHLTTFMQDGVAGYKIDPGRTINEHPDRKYYNGLADSEMHQLQQVLVAKNVNLTCSEFNQNRPFLHYCGGYAGIQQWAALTSGDNGGGAKALFDQLNLGMSGHINTSCDILEQVFPMSAGIHFGFMLPWTQLNSWAFIHHPWYYTESEKAMFRFYDNLRYSLIPYIYSTALNGSFTGMPILRAMPLVYPNDSALANITSQYMFGDNFLVTAFSNTTRLPEGNWIDYWTGSQYAGNRNISLETPKDRGGLLFVKAGAIIPCQKPMQYVDEFPADTLILKVYPSGESFYTMYEDDGISYNYSKGAVAKTEFKCKSDGQKLELFISKREGKYANMPLHRTFLVELYGSQFKNIVVNNIPLKSEKNIEDKQNKVVKFSVNIE